MYKRTRFFQEIDNGRYIGVVLGEDVVSEALVVLPKGFLCKWISSCYHSSKSKSFDDPQRLVIRN
ncbi:hypothetical protein K469DRAFT_37926, partial [Zopfia rhizophila CBS 207.26]